jgi:hypothetical protein
VGFATPWTLQEAASEVPERVNAGQLLGCGSKETALAANSCFISRFPAAITRTLSIRTNELLTVVPANLCFKNGQFMLEVTDRESALRAFNLLFGLSP